MYTKICFLYFNDGKDFHAKDFKYRRYGNYLKNLSSFEMWGNSLEFFNRKKEIFPVTCFSGIYGVGKGMANEVRLNCRCFLCSVS